LAEIFKIDHYNFELYRFKVGAFFETQCNTYTLLYEGLRWNGDLRKSWELQL